MDETLQLRIYGDASLPTLIYLPGLHGDWTLIGGFRSAVAGKVRFVEMTYPRDIKWSLDDYAAAIEEGLMRNGISRGWLLAESFGSQPAWVMLARGRFAVQGLILAGGFVKHPVTISLRLAERMTRRLSARFLVKIIFAYAKYARFRYRRSPETLATLDEFVARRTPQDREAAQYRLHLLGENDQRDIARKTTVPVYGLAGFLDPIVPWPPVRRWLKRNCPALRDYKVIGRADHNVLNTGTKDAAQWVLKWMKEGVS